MKALDTPLDLKRKEIFQRVFTEKLKTMHSIAFKRKLFLAGSNRKRQQALKPTRRDPQSEKMKSINTNIGNTYAAIKRRNVQFVFKMESINTNNNIVIQEEIQTEPIEKVIKTEYEELDLGVDEIPEDENIEETKTNSGNELPKDISKHFTSRRMAFAIEEVKNGMSTYKAAIKFQVPQSTVG
jgi:hypothetical protein